MYVIQTADVGQSPLEPLTEVRELGKRRYRIWSAGVVSAIFEAEAHLGLERRGDRRDVHYLALALIRRRAKGTRARRAYTNDFDVAAVAA